MPIASFNRRQIFEGSTQFVLRSLIVASNLLPTLNFPNPPNLFDTVQMQISQSSVSGTALHCTVNQKSSFVIGEPCEAFLHEYHFDDISFLE